MFEYIAKGRDINTARRRKIDRDKYYEQSFQQFDLECCVGVNKQDKCASIRRKLMPDFQVEDDVLAVNNDY